ncbi:MAG: VIT1/CCC1 transporter family protein [Bacteroidaceae bacterium]|nr:VIT1/CCC1 transporter family protein [Bacteroidaceae bacterium]
MTNLSGKDLKALLHFQRNELMESLVYHQLAKCNRDKENKLTLDRIAHTEQLHYDTVRRVTNQSVKIPVWRYLLYYWMARILGLTFAVKLMERNGDVPKYHKFFDEIPELKSLHHAEADEAGIINLINEEKLAYTGAIVLGLNDALVEFTGVLAGFTLALNKHMLIALTGSITGISAAMSMACSVYLSTRAEKKEDVKPRKSAAYTGLAYIMTVVFLVSPFVMFSNVFAALGIMLMMAVLIIFVFNYYYAIACDEKFGHRFWEMTILSFSVAGISFIVGYLLKLLVGVDA